MLFIEVVLAVAIRTHVLETLSKQGHWDRGVVHFAQLYGVQNQQQIFIHLSYVCSCFAAFMSNHHVHACWLWGER